MRRLLLSAFFTLASGLAQGVSLPAYTTRVDVAEHGASNATLQLQVEDAVPGPLLVPLAPSLKPGGAVILSSGPAGTRVKLVSVGERPHFEVTLPEDTPKSVSLALAFPVQNVLAEPKAKAQGKRSLPEGSLLLEHAFVNTQPVAIGRYRVQVTLPDGTRVQEVREQTPKTRRNEIEPRVALNAKDGRQGALLQLADVRQGDRTSMALEVVPDRRGPMWLIVGLALAVGYLVGFRDLVSSRKGADAA